MVQRGAQVNDTVLTYVTESSQCNMYLSREYYSRVIFPFHIVLKYKSQFHHAT